MSPSHDTEHGFTLLELLVAMTLLGLIMLMLFGGLRLGTRVWEAGSARAEDRARVEIAQRFLRSYIARARATDRQDRRPRSTGSFLGSSNRLEFAALIPAHLSVGGFHRIVISTDDDDEGRRNLTVSLVLLQATEDESGDASVADGAMDAVLLGDIADTQFSYYGVRRGDDQARWDDDWEELDGVPRLVRLRIVFGDGDNRAWPDLVVSPRSAVPPRPDRRRGVRNATPR